MLGHRLIPSGDVSHAQPLVNSTPNFRTRALGCASMSAGQTGRVALITGGAGGLGSAIARTLARDRVRVVVAGRHRGRALELASSIRADGGWAIGVEMDVRDPLSVDTAVTTAADGAGGVDVLVNVAGWDQLKPFLETDEAFWQEILEVNFKGGVRVTHALLPGMIERRWGRIVNISSDAGRVGSSLESAYAGSKGAIIAFTKALARETARLGITANVV